jgi:uncharacterized delta-60 repeat protein
MRYPKALVRVLLLLAIVFVHWVSLSPPCQGFDGWPVRYNGPGNGEDVTFALAVDGQGNVYVTGESTGAESGSDYATIKYAPSGERLWAKRYNGPGNSTDSASALAVDGQGNVYVTGESTGAESGSDYTTIKYSAAGNLLWAKRYNGPGNSSDVANAIAVDGSGNVYVTGESVGLGSSNDYATIKYSPAGERLWVRRYIGMGDSGATALAVDAEGNVYVTGGSYGYSSFMDYATLKYSAAGNLLWAKRYNGPGNSTDSASAIAVDAQGNVYVTGYSTGTGSFYDYTTLKYSPSGQRLWVRRYNGPGNEYDLAKALAVDAAGNVYVTGESKGAGSGSDYATLKYGPTGEPLWLRRYNGPGNEWDSAEDLALDGQGNAYVTGGSTGAGSSSDSTTLKYSPSGQRLWVRRYNGPGNDGDAGNAIALDGQGNFYVTGESAGIGTDYDYATLKYNQE